METNSKYETVYRNVAKNGLRFAIEQINGVRDYSRRDYMSWGLASEINARDKLLLLTADAHYPFTTEDIGQMAYQLLINKILLGARETEAQKLYKHIRNAFII